MTSGDIWYLDTSAFVKMLVEEEESPALARWLSNRTPVSSDLLRTEARRAVHRHDHAVRSRCEHALAGVALVRLTPELFDRAGALEGQRLRSLDALHLAAALELGEDLEGLVTYDERLAETATELGIRIAAPR